LDIEYKVNQSITTDQFINLLNASTLGLRRPVDDRACVEGMLKHGNLLVTAWHEEKLVGVARSVTDFYFACYLSDLAVDEDYQKMGIGKQLQVLTQAQLGPKCSLILLAAPAANDYYSHIGFSHHPRCWVLDRQDSITV
jgi:ribosomal protein S18 acetylase RimI-like enzyme